MRPDGRNAKLPLPLPGRGLPVSPDRHPLRSVTVRLPHFRGADLLQVCCTGFNGKLGSSFSQLFQAVDPASNSAMAA